MTAVTESPPEPAPSETAAPADPSSQGLDSGLAGLLGSGDHKTIGRLWIGFSLLFLLVGLVCGTLLSVESISPDDLDVLGTDAYFQVFTLERVAGVFLFGVPLFVGLATYVVPLQVGSPALAFPRAGAAAFWTWLIAGGLVLASYAINGGPDGGDADGVQLFLVAFAVLVAALAVALICIVTTVMTLRTRGMTLDRVPLFSWSMLVAGWVWLLSLPVLVGNLLLIELDYEYGQVFFGVPGDAYLQLAWVFGPPQLSLLAVPALGVCGEIIPVSSQSRQRLRGVLLVALAVLGTLGFGAWVQPALVPDVTTDVVYVTVVIAALVPLLAIGAVWAGTVFEGRLRPSASLALAVVAFIALLVGIAAGAVGAIDSLDLRGTSWDAGQFRLVLLGAAAAGLAGVSYWAPKVWGRFLPRAATGVAAGLLLLAIPLWTVPDLVAGTLDAPLLLPDPDPETAVEVAGVVASVGGVLVVVAAALFLGGVASVIIRRRATTAADDPWGGHTLEWATSSPPPAGNFAEPPPVRSASPLLDEDDDTEPEDGA